MADTSLESKFYAADPAETPDLDVPRNSIRGWLLGALAFTSLAGGNIAAYKVGKAGSARLTVECKFDLIDEAITARCKVPLKVNRLALSRDNPIPSIVVEHGGRLYRCLASTPLVLPDDHADNRNFDKALLKCSPF